ncbi:MAG: exodeoxyribonuclease VII large subunit [Patescibacteria group bacterium]
MEINESKILSVSEYISFLNSGLKEYEAKIIGEVSEVKTGPTGHVYFFLKDENDGAVMSCIIWKSNYNLYGIGLEVGMKIMATGSPNIYAPSGRLSFIADAIELAGAGALKKEYERLKKQLSAEGLFAKERKRKVKNYPQKIGVITSKQGAVIADFLSNIGSFGFTIKMIDSRVEGQEAVADLLVSIKTFKKYNLDALVIMRGGGSLESMMAFNNEKIVREVAGFPAPVVVGVGHHKDEPLVGFAADVSVSTPTAAANFLNESWNQALLLIERYERDTVGRYEEILENYKNIENKLKVSFQSFKNALGNVKISLRNSLERYLSGFDELLSKANQKLRYAEKAIALNDPERQLKLGYSIASSGGKIIRKTGDAKIGQNIDLKVVDGIINSEVKKISPAIQPRTKRQSVLEK